MIKIAIESTGCDNGFEEVLRGSRNAIRKNKDLELILVAGEDKLPKINSLPKRISLQTSKYTYDSNPKNKICREQSSIYLALELHKNGEVDAVIAPGDTRGTAHASLAIAGLIPGVLAPAIPTHWPINNVLIDSGANIATTPEHMLQSAIMGKVYSQGYLGVRRPLIGILTNGAERTKGNRFIRQSRKLIESLVDPKKAGYNVSPEYFEGDFFKNLDSGRVAVTDGHTGNIFLKGVEQALKTTFKNLSSEVEKEFFLLKGFAYLGMLLPLRRIKKRFAYENYSACPLLGIDANIMICHGKSSAKSITNAIRITKKYIGCDINTRLAKEIQDYHWK